MNGFASEAELCRQFIEAATAKGLWRAYPETDGFDILMSRVSDGVQIGIEAKLSFNAKVVAQALPRHLEWTFGIGGPDYRAVLVPGGSGDGLGEVCAALGITVIRFWSSERYGQPFVPALPTGDNWSDRNWHDWCPLRRSDLPEYVPDVVAGASAPLALTTWKVKAIKLAILLEERPVTRADFKMLDLSPSRWTEPYSGWLVKGQGGYVRGPRMPNFKAQHPRNYEEIKADRAKWAPVAAVLI